MCSSSTAVAWFKWAAEQNRTEQTLSVSAGAFPFSTFSAFHFCLQGTDFLSHHLPPAWLLLSLYCPSNVLCGGGQVFSDLFLFPFLPCSYWFALFLEKCRRSLKIWLFHISAGSLSVSFSFPSVSTLVRSLREQPDIRCVCEDACTVCKIYRSTFLLQKCSLVSYSSGLKGTKQRKSAIMTPLPSTSVMAAPLKVIYENVSRKTMNFSCRVFSSTFTLK